jgi:biopolymer transport protein ExbD
MMEFGTRPAPSRRENIVPMINVVFLLLIFFLMTASLEPAPPIEIGLPAAEADPGTDLHRLFVGAGGELVFNEARGDAALALLAQTGGAVVIHADAGLPASALARLLADLATLGLTRTDLATTGIAP